MVRSQVPAQRYMMILQCRVTAFLILEFIRSTNVSVVAPDMHQVSRGKSFRRQAFRRVYPLLSDTRIQVLYWNPSGICGCFSIYRCNFLLMSLCLHRQHRKLKCQISGEFPPSVKFSQSSTYLDQEIVGWNTMCVCMYSFILHPDVIFQLSIRRSFCF